ncbi:MAG: PD-(D/E)XK nuclease family protein [Thaumarchaeota archaeon]|nr:PD-(D/E)XK nuclease family protein [Nitrososphaerota archaeon]
MILERAPERGGRMQPSGGRIPIPEQYGGPAAVPETGGASAPQARQRRPPFRHIPSMIGGPVASMTPEHRYVTPEGQTYGSVTTVLGGTKPEEDAMHLEEWRRSVGYAVADYITREAATVGTQAHLLNEYYLRGMTPDESDEPFRLMARAHHENFLPHLDRIDNIRGTELVLHSDRLRLAGTSDCIGEYDGVPSIIDYKTKRAPQEPERMHDYYLQAAAYAMMYEGLSGIAVEQAVIMVSSEKDTMQVFTARTRDFMDEFLERLDMWYGRIGTGGFARPFLDDVQLAAAWDFRP